MMNNHKILLGAAGLLMAAALAAGAYYYMSAKKHGSHAQLAGQPVTNATADDIFDTAGSDAPAIEIPEGAVRLMGIKAVPAAVIPMRQIIRTVGRVEVDEKRLHNVNAKVEGWIEKLFVDYTGKLVKKGEPVAEVYSPELLATQQELLDSIKWAGERKEQSEAKADAKGEYADMLTRDADSVTKAARQRLVLWDIPDSQIDEIIKSGKPMRTLKIYSPANGYVMEKTAVLGARIMPGEKLFTIADLDTVWVLADVYESEMHYIKPGQEARITMSHLPGMEITSKVDFIYPSLNIATRTLQVRFEVKNPDGELMPSMYTDIALSIEMGRRLTVPKSAVIDSGQRQVVYVDRGQGYFEPREIRTGISGDSAVEVTEGLEAGDMVAESGTFLLDSEAQLKGVKPIGTK